MTISGEEQEHDRWSSTAVQAVPSEEHREVGALLKRHRIMARLTQVELADLSTVSLRTIRNLEAGRARHPRPETVRLLADGLRLGPRAFETLSLAMGRGSQGAAVAAAVGNWQDAAHVPTGPLLGRDHEIASAMRAIRSGTSRLICLTGFGGVGKSRLAAAIVEAAADKCAMPWLWVSSSMPEAGTSAAATSAEPSANIARWTADFLAGEQSAIDELALVAGTQAFLLVVDDVPVARGALDAVEAELLQRCPGLVIVETTRHGAGTARGYMMPVRPLAVEASTPNGRSSPAVDLLVAHARTAAPELESLEPYVPQLLDICRALDGLPRAIENAASWLALCWPDQIADMARTDPFAVGHKMAEGGRQERWAYTALVDAVDALDPRARELLEQLCRLPGSWSLVDLAATRDVDGAETASAVQGLLSVGLIRPAGTVRHGEPRLFTALNHVKNFFD